MNIKNKGYLKDNLPFKIIDVDFKKLIKDIDKKIKKEIKEI